MRILWLNWRDIKNPQGGGAEIMTHETAKRFVRDNHEVTILTSKFPGCSNEEVLDGVKIIRRGNQLTCHIWAVFLYFKQFKGKVELVVDEINTLPYFTNFFIKEKKIALIHQLAREYWWHEMFFPINLIGFLLEPLYLKLYKDIPTIAASESTKTDLVNIGFKKVMVFYQGLSIKPLQTVPAKSKTPLILFIGRLTKPKGADDALKAFSFIKQKFINARLKFCVRGSKKALLKLQKQIRSLRLLKEAEILPFITNTEKVRLLKKAHLVLIPSLREGWNLVAIEANSFGAVPVGYNVGGLKDSIRHKKTGILARENSPQGLAKATTLVLSNQKLYEKLSKTGLAWSKQFDWDKTYKSFSIILKDFGFDFKKNRVLLLSWRDPKNPLAGGAEYVMHEHSKGWVKNGWNVVLFSSYFRGAKRQETLDGITIIRKGHQILGVHISAWFYYFFGKHPDFDLIIDNFHGIPFFTPFYAGIKKLAVIQEVTKEVWLLNNLPKPLDIILGRIGYVLEPLTFRIYHNIQFMTGSNSARKDLIKFNMPRKNIHVIPHGFTGKPMKLVKKKPIKPIMFLGSLTKDKGIEDAIITFGLLKNEKDISFWVVGRYSSSYLKQLHIIAKKVGVDRKIKFYGFVNETTKFKLLSNAYVLINPSAREGWGLVNIEANSVGTPVIAYNSPGLIDSVRDGINGIICKNNTPPELANNIIIILRNPQIYKRLQKGALMWSKKFTWEKSRKMSLQLIEKVANESL